MANKSEIVAALRRERRRQKMPLYQLAKRAGLRVSTAQGLDANPDIRAATAEAIARALGFEIKLVPRRRRKG